MPETIQITSVADDTTDTYKNIADTALESSGADAIALIILDGKEGTGISLLSKSYEQRRVLQDILEYSHQNLKKQNDEQLAKAKASAALRLSSLVAEYGEKYTPVLQEALLFIELQEAEEKEREQFISSVMKDVLAKGLTTTKDLFEFKAAQKAEKEEANG